MKLGRNTFLKIWNSELKFRKAGKPLKWVKKTEQPKKNRILKGSLSVPYSKAYMGYSGNNHVHTQADL
jgi:hypothetical protein